MKLSATLFLAAAAAPAVVVAQTATCPAGDRVSYFGGALEGCVLCVPSTTTGQCRAHCTCSDMSCSNPTCTTDPDGCGTVKCPGDDASPTPAPFPGSPTTTTAAPPPSGDPECGIVVTVGCVLWDDRSTKCEDYVPTSDAECSVQVRYEYTAEQTAPPTDAVLESIYRYREGSYWGSPKPYNEDKWGENLTPSMGWYWNMAAAEGEFVDFCKPSSVSTTFEFKTNGGSLGEACAEVGSYTLATMASATLTMEPIMGTLSDVEEGEIGTEISILDANSVADENVTSTTTTPAAMTTTADGNGTTTSTTAAAGTTTTTAAGNGTTMAPTAAPSSATAKTVSAAGLAAIAGALSLMAL